jgi:predicted membrane protein
MPFVYIAVAVIFVVAIAQISKIYIPMPEILRAALNVVWALIIVGMILWVINTYIPMAGGIKALLNIVVFLATCVGVLQALGLWAPTVKIWTDFRSHRLNQ